jgi:hypothetical protein
MISGLFSAGGGAGTRDQRITKPTILTAVVLADNYLCRGGPMEQRDRRVRRTRRALIEAFVSLVVQNRYEQITVQDILDAADIGRSTFYAHFSGKGCPPCRVLRR